MIDLLPGTVARQRKHSVEEAKGGASEGVVV